MEVPTIVILPCQFVTKLNEFTVKLTVPVKMPFESTCAVIVVGTVPPVLLLVIEPMRDCFRSIWGMPVSIRLLNIVKSPMMNTGHGTTNFGTNQINKKSNRMDICLKPNISYIY